MAEIEKKVAILQSNYIPWKGYFDMINLVDEFIILDEVQYTRRDWRNRNKIKTQNGLLWITIPVMVKGNFLQKISETKISEEAWAEKHWQTLKMVYSKAPFFKMYENEFADFYLNTAPSLENLSQINQHLILLINEILGIKTKISLDKDYGVVDGANERLLDLCKKASATCYLSGPAAQDYMDTSLFNKENIEVEWMDYSGYKEYNQQYPPFQHGVSILDLLFSEGENARLYMKSFDK